MSTNRSEKIADLLKKEISLIISNEIKDPRLKNINVTAVKVSDDIGMATAFYTIIGKSVKKDDSEIDNEILKKFSEDPNFLVDLCQVKSDFIKNSIWSSFIFSK